MASYTENEKLSNNPVLNKVRAAKRKFIEDNPITASSKALSKRGYNKYDSSWKNEPSTVDQYSQGIGSTEIAQQQANQMDDSGANWAAVLGNQARLIPEYMTELPAMARSMTPLFTGAETWSDWWEGQKYVGPIDLPRSLTQTKLSMDEKVGMNGFVKIAKKQNDEEFQQTISGLLGRQIDSDTIFDWILPEANKAGWNIETKADAERMFNENEDFNKAVNGFVDELQNDPELEKTMMYGRDWFQDEDNYYVKNFKERPGFNFAWTQYNDLALPGLGIYKIDDDGVGSMLRAAPLSYKGIPGLEQLQKAGYWGTDPSSIGEEDYLKYNMMFDGDNPSTQMISQMAAVPLSIATGNIKNIMHLPQAAKNISNLKAFGKTGVLRNKPTRPVWSKPLGEGWDFAPQSGIVKETAKSLTGYPMAKSAWQNKGKVGIAAIPAAWGAYGPNWP